MTRLEMEKIFSSEIPKDLEIDKGIYEFHSDGNKSIGVSYEHFLDKNEEYSAGYIFNLFLEDEYINIDGVFDTPEEGIGVVTEMWNSHRCR